MLCYLGKNNISNEFKKQLIPNLIHLVGKLFELVVVQAKH